MCNVHICHCFTPWLNSSNVGEINIPLDYALSLVSFGPLSKKRKRHEQKTAGRQTLAVRCISLNKLREEKDCSPSNHVGTCWKSLILSNSNPACSSIGKTLSNVPTFFSVLCPFGHTKCDMSWQCCKCMIIVGKIVSLLINVGSI